MAAADLPKVLVSILNFNSFENTVDTIRSYLAQDFQNMTLQVVDNASTDGCLEKIRALFPSLKIIALPQNTGYVGGNNYALEQGLKQGYDLVVISNEDIEIAPNFITNLVETALSKADAGVIGAVEYDFFTQRIKAWSSTRFNFWLGRNRWSTDAPAENQVYSSPYVQGAAVAFTRKALELGVRYDDKLFIYVDEIDLGLSLEKLGLKAYVDTRCKVFHKCRPKPFNPKTAYLLQRNRFYLVRKHGSAFDIAFNTLYIALIELPIKSVVRLLQRRFRFTRACWLGFFDGLLGRMYAGQFFKV